jgi:hypothetical protein
VDPHEYNSYTIPSDSITNGRICFAESRIADRCKDRSSSQGEVDQLFFRQISFDGWKQQNNPTIEAKTKDRIEIALVEDMNTRSRLVVRDSQTGTRSLLLDPNPQFRNLQFGWVEEIKFKMADGHEMTAG